MNADTIARIKITLDKVKPAVWRRLEAPLDITLDRLHRTIQAAMGWDDDHLHEFRAGKFRWSTPDSFAGWDPEAEGFRRAQGSARRYSRNDRREEARLCLRLRRQL